MRVIFGFIITSVFILISTFAFGSKSDFAPPVCEASAASIVPCDSDSGTCLLVGDNERETELYLFNIDWKKKRLIKRKDYRLPIGPVVKQDLGGSNRVDDIEAFAKLSDKQLIVLGSHSRNKRCESKKHRRKFFHVKVENGQLHKGLGKAVKSRKHKCARLFDDNRNAHQEKVCKLIQQRKKAADKIEENEENRSRNEMEKACNDSPPLNLEGAVVKKHNGNKRVWVGLRAPLFDKKAILLRMKNKRDAFQFDDVAYLDLGGAGVRGLERNGDKIWVISGSEIDSEKKHTLSYFHKSKLKNKAVIKPTPYKTLPNRAEGMAIWKNRAIIVLDGDEVKDDDTQCNKPSGYIFMDLN